MLYGPVLPKQFIVYNSILRQWPAEVYSKFKDQNLFTTTIFVLVSQPYQTPVSDSKKIYECSTCLIDDARFGVDNKQVLAVQKIARVMVIKPGMKLYRGLGGTVSLPESFFHTDTNGCRGFAQWGFMSTTSKREVQFNYLWQKKLDHDSQESE